MDSRATSSEEGVYLHDHGSPLSSTPYKFFTFQTPSQSTQGVECQEVPLRLTGVNQGINVVREIGL